MIGIINMPCESPSEYYATPPRSADDAPLFVDDRPKQTPTHQYTPDGIRIGALSQQSQSAESLWAGAIKRSIVYQLGRDQLRRKAISCCNFSQIVDMLDTSSTGKNPTAVSNKRKFSVETLDYKGNNELPPLPSLLSPNVALADSAQELSKSLPRYCYGGMGYAPTMNKACYSGTGENLQINFSSRMNEIILRS